MGLTPRLEPLHRTIIASLSSPTSRLYYFACSQKDLTNAGFKQHDPGFIPLLSIAINLPDRSPNLSHTHTKRKTLKHMRSITFSSPAAVAKG